MKKKTIYESALEHGFSRRDFLKMCTALAAALGLDFTQSDKVADAMETKSRVPVVWLQFQDCTGCSESFIRSHIQRSESVLFDMISLRVFRSFISSIWSSSGRCNGTGIKGL